MFPNRLSGCPCHLYILYNLATNKDNLGEQYTRKTQGQPDNLFEKSGL